MLVSFPETPLSDSFSSVPSPPYGFARAQGMRSATPPYIPSASCPSFAFLLRALKDNGRAGEVQPFFDEVCAWPEVRASRNQSIRYFSGTLPTLFPLIWVIGRSR